MLYTSPMLPLPPTANVKEMDLKLITHCLFVVLETAFTGNGCHGNKEQASDYFKLRVGNLAFHLISEMKGTKVA